MTTASLATLFQPPRPPAALPKLSLWQYTKILRRNVIETWPDCAYEQELFRLDIFGQQNLLINAPAGIEHVLVHNAANYRRTAPTLRILGPVLGEGLVLSDGDQWRTQRRILAPRFTPRITSTLTGYFVASGASAVTRMEAEMDKPIDLLPALQHVTLETVSRSLFSLQMTHHEAALRRMTTRYVATLGRFYLSDLLLPRWIPTWSDLRRWLTHIAWARVIDAVIEEHQTNRSQDTPQDLFDVLLAARDPSTGRGFSHTELRDQIATLIVTGHETTALALFWACFLLASASGVQERVAAEVQDIEFEPERDDGALSRLIYARAVISEALRLYPPVHLISREAISDDHCAGVTIPAGSVVMVAPWVLHRHRRFCPDPDAFDPERFLGSAPAAYTYVPFGAGPRICIGQHFALAEATIILAMMIQHFRITRADSEPVLPIGSNLTYPSRAAPFWLKRR
jgi:cytochrome P450